MVYLILGFFIHIIFSAIIYMVLSDIIDGMLNQKLENIKKSFGKEVLKQLNTIKENKDISKMDMDYIRDNINKKLYFKAFNSIIIEFNKDEYNHQYSKMYLKNFEDIIIKKVLKYDKSKDNTIKTYQSILLGEYKLSNYEINNFLINCLESESLNLRTSSLNSISQIGNINNFIRAISHISDNDKYINNKIFCDIIDNFKGDKIALDKALIKELENFNYTIQKIIIEHFNNKNIDFIKDIMLEMLRSDKTNKEAKISIIKYFANIEYRHCVSEIIKIINEYEWEYRAVCALALGNYNLDITKKALLKSIKDKNWYVRYNSATSLLRLNDEYVISKVLNEDDKFAREMLLYAIDTNKQYKPRGELSLCLS